MKVLGVMSGSSMDGFDLALCNFSADIDNWQFQEAKSYPISDSLVTRLKMVFEGSVEELLETERIFNEELAKSIEEFRREYQLNWDLISTHGHTVAHIPGKGISLQIGNGGMLSSLTSTKVCSDFRIQDVSLGGSGTPLIPIAERDLFKGYDAYLNLGGIANISFFSQSETTAYDVCPCNQVLNYIASKKGLSYDENGSLARLGTVDQEVLTSWLAHEYFEEQPPKSLDNNFIRAYWFKQMDDCGLVEQDMLATFVECICRLISKASNHLNAGSKLFVTGGGALNLFLVERLKQVHGEKIEILVPENQIVEFKEAILMAYMGYLRSTGEINIIRSVTGARSSLSSGAIYLPPHVD